MGGFPWIPRWLETPSGRVPDMRHSFFLVGLVPDSPRQPSSQTSPDGLDSHCRSAVMSFLIEGLRLDLSSTRPVILEESLVGSPLVQIVWQRLQTLNYKNTETKCRRSPPRNRGKFLVNKTMTRYSYRKAKNGLGQFTPSAFPH